MRYGRFTLIELLVAVPAEARRAKARATSIRFTLIELLVVVTILAVLAALLLPALSEARAKAKLVQCVSQHKQVYLALALYAEENEMVFPNGCIHSGWGPGAQASGYFCEKDYLGVSVYDGLPGRHVLRGLTVLWGMKYFISYKNRLNFACWTPPPWHASIPLAANGWSSGTYVFYTQVGRPPFPGQAGIGGDGSGAPRRFGRPVKWGDSVANTAVSMCRMGKPSWTNVGAHQKLRMNVTYEDGHVRIQGGVREQLAYLLLNAPGWRADIGNEVYYIDDERLTWWRWVTAQDNR